MFDRLPALLVLTDRVQAEAAHHELTAIVTELSGSSEVAVVFREKDLVADERALLGRRVAHAARAAGVGLLVASDSALADELEADGVHLASDDDLTLRPGLVGRSCHTSSDLVRAAAQGATYATVSPVFETASKPGYGPALGLAGLSELARAVDVPVYALGGVTADRVTRCVEAGAFGVAVMGAVMTADEPRAVVDALVDAVLGSRALRGETR